ncbi:RNA polymerase sigma-70 factor (ECF subfamily) [Kribbella sp. VKM Ac-2571]|uniref:RNA polymerase sigma-70 factor n=1 Tax=Kribbella sp. VKM Ac-2571 TaxID=2512222 RepID=UPI0010612848|nr:RNA polymerase sigma-70 factor [Kribbella sp. VKM Ac-2571]TDO58955.1 RNA polymerase sigma-70 factor (ECF subfamily) [Kribbella sp. VKM Ac-2571]
MTDELDDAVAVFDAVRPRLMGIAYRMLGSHAEAEDLVQEVWLRWQAADRSAVQSPVAYLSTAVTRLAINASQSARARRETYIGPWLPEPVDTSADPYLGAERGEALSFAVLLVLERLSPTERAAYILREAFDYSYGELAAMLQSTEPAVRQLVSRARKRIRAERRTEVSGAQQKTLLTAFIAAARAGDVSVLEELLANDAISYSDGGGAARASKFPVVGRLRVAKYHRAFHQHFWIGVEVEFGTANGRAVAMLRRDGAVFAVCTVTASDEGIDEVLWQMNPAKLTTVA